MLSRMLNRKKAQLNKHLLWDERSFYVLNHLTIKNIEIFLSKACSIVALCSEWRPALANAAEATKLCSNCSFYPGSNATKRALFFTYHKNQ